MVGLSEERRAELYQIAIDDNKTLEERWEATRQLRENKTFNPLLGDMETVIKNNQRLVLKVVNRSIQRTTVRAEFEELVQEGMIGLYKAYRDYDGRTAFSTAAYAYIHNEVRIFLRDKCSMIHIPAHIYELTGKILMNKWEEESPESIADKSGCTLKSAKYALHYLKYRNLASLNKVNRKSDRQNGETINLLQGDFDFTSPFVKDFINTLNEEETLTLMYITKGYPYRDIGSIFGVSRNVIGEYVKQIRIKAVRYFELQEVPA